MKRIYTAPNLEIEQYELDVNIASHCGIVVQNGPAMGNHIQCADYTEPFALRPGKMEAKSEPHNVLFYEDTNCDCYTSGGDYGYWTS